MNTAVKDGWTPHTQHIRTCMTT